MAVIKVRPEDKERVFEILSTNGRFMGLPDDRFNIIEHPDDILKKLKEAGIVPIEID